MKKVHDEFGLDNVIPMVPFCRTVDEGKKVIQILEENGKLAIHLSGDHKNLDNISKADSEAEVLIFKQALALGWDCPRAHILVLFRDWKSIVFSIQTIG